MPFPNTPPQNNPVPPQINTSAAHADPAWRKAALAIVKRLARKRETLTSADVLERLDNSEVKTRDLRAVGCVMVEARNLGIISNAGLVRRSNKHSRGVTTLWRSLLFSSDKQSSQQTSVTPGGAL
jgi:hypothetical protein